MKQTEWKDDPTFKSPSFKESLIVMDNGGVLFKLRVFADGSGIIRNGGGKMIYEQRQTTKSLLGTPIEQALEHWVRELLSGDIQVIRKTLEVMTPTICDILPKQFIKEVHEYIDHGKCETCDAVTARFEYSREDATLHICYRCKLKFMLIDPVE